MYGCPRTEIEHALITTCRWNASLAFASYLDEHQELYRDRNVLELGAGGALPGIVTAKNGAKRVTTLLKM